MPDGVKISELDQVASLTNQDIMPVCQPDAQSDTGFITKRCTILDVASKLFGDIQYTSQLNTTVKTGWGAINELKTDCDNADKKLADNAIVNIDGATFACFITNTLITLSKSTFVCEINPACLSISDCIVFILSLFLVCFL